MKQIVLKYKGIVAFMALILAFGFIVSCSDDDDDTQVLPEIASVDKYFPNSGKEGAGTIIQGANFSVIPKENKVLFSGVEATVRSATRTTLLVAVPIGATTGEVTISVNGATPVVGPSFTVLLPTVDVLLPVAGGVGETVIITGTNFSDKAAENKVWFNGVASVVTDATATKLTTTVPASAETGNISVQVKDGSIVDGLSFEVKEEITLEIQITELFDDVEEAGANAESLGYVPGTMDLNSSDLELGEIDSWYGTQVLGLRFRGVTIPKGATILSANIQFECDAPGAGPVNLRIVGENIGNSPEYTDELFNVSSRPNTTASVLWTVPEWVAVGDRGAAQKTINLAAIVQEIVNRGDWEANNSLNFILTQEGANSATGSDGRESETSKSEGKGPSIVIIYK